jgi:hypothetical protein
MTILRSLVLLGTSFLIFTPFTPTIIPQQNPKKYSWQAEGTNCNQGMTFCWYGTEDVSDPQVTAYGNRWISQDKDEKPFEWVTEVRCVQEFHTCILAKNQKAPIGGGSITSIDLYRVEDWSNFQIRALGENDLPRGRECEIDSLLLNRAEGSVSMLSVPGPAAATKLCMGIMKPKTVIYKLEIGPPAP